MTDREKAIVMAYTGACMLTGDKFQIFHKYVEEIMGRPIWTHEMVQFADEIKEKSKADFMALCADENPNEWIPVSERLPEDSGRYLAYIINKHDNRLQYIMTCDYLVDSYWNWFPDDECASDNVIAWMPLPEPYREETKKVNCENTKCDSCVNHNYCDYEPYKAESQKARGSGR